MATPFRQHPGSACEECRRRKARCDRVRPCCGTCSLLARPCIFNEQRAQRGPKKGQIRALRDRVQTLERALAAPQHAGVPPDPVPSPLLEAPPLPTPDIQASWGFDAGLPVIFEQSELPELPELPRLPSLSSESEGKTGKCSDCDEDPALMQDDIVAVYFERVHPNLPIIHKLRYLDILDQQSPSESQRCLQLAVEATAAASTAQGLKASGLLYAEACSALEKVEIAGPISRARGVRLELDYIQALLLIVYYEALRMPQSRYLLSAGRAFRLVQIARLHETDLETASIEEPSPEGFARQEERRRTFWAAYCLDRMLNIRHELPHTLHDVVAHTRLPAPEANFQDSSPVRMPFLCDAISNPGTAILPVLAETVVLATLQGRCMTLRVAPSGGVDKTCTELQSIRLCLHQRLQMIARHLPRGGAAADPTLGFTHILAYGLMITINELAESMAFAMTEQQKSATLCLAEALVAYNETVELAKSTCRLGRFKTNLFLPVLLFRAITFITNHQPHGQLRGLAELISILERLSRVNRQAEELIQELRGIDTNTR
ncbi:fungal-specific transcription factor domain-containing protein [Aspergillus aurantiobrunneus]